MLKLRQYAVLSGFSVFSFSASASGFVTEINWSADPISLAALTEGVRGSARANQGGLSLGESHLEGETTNAVHSIFLDAYLGEKPTELRTCLEQTTGIFHSRNYSAVQSASADLKVQTKNSPIVTDFADCFTRTRDHYLVYSGFYHQHPFAAAFPEIFPKTPVITDPKNNIQAQMKSADLIFIAQLELPYLAMLETTRLLNLARRSPDEFGEELARTEQSFGELKKNLRPFVESPIPEAAKSGVILNQEFFPRYRRAFPHGRAYLLLTDLGHRQSRSPLFWLDEIRKLAPEVQSAFFHRLKQEKYFLTTPLTPAASADQPSHFQISGIDEDFSGELFGLTFYGGKVSRMLLVDPTRGGLRCFRTSNQKTTEGDCAEIMSGRPASATNDLNT